MEVGIYIKSCFRGNPRGAGKAAAVIEYVDKSGSIHKRQQWIEIKKDTKNALHLKICNAAMRLLLKPCNVTIFIDCDYMANVCGQGWLESWKRNGWKKADGQLPSNAEEWKGFYILSQIHGITFKPYNPKYDKELEEILENESRYI